MARMQARPFRGGVRAIPEAGQSGSGPGGTATRALTAKRAWSHPAATAATRDLRCNLRPMQVHHFDIAAWQAGPAPLPSFGQMPPKYRWRPSADHAERRASRHACIIYALCRQDLCEDGSYYNPSSQSQLVVTSGPHYQCDLCRTLMPMRVTDYVRSGASRLPASPGRSG